MHRSVKIAAIVLFFAAMLFPARAQAQSYNRWAAVSYARQHASADRGPDNNYAYNPSYKSYGNDCANFVSQCLRAGGWQDTGWFYYSDYNWFNNSGGFGYHQSTWSWFNATDLLWFSYYSGRGYFINSWSQAQPGDIAFVNWDGSFPPTHAVIISAVDAWGNIYLAQHSNNRLDKPLWQYYADKPRAAFWVFHVTGTY